MNSPLKSCFSCLSLKPQLWQIDLNQLPIRILCCSCDPLIEGTLGISCRPWSAPIGSHWNSVFVSVCIPSNMVCLYFQFFFGKLPLGLLCPHEQRARSAWVFMSPQTTFRQWLMFEREYETPAPLTLVRTFWDIIYNPKISFWNKLKLPKICPFVWFLPLSCPASSSSLIVSPGNTSLINYLYSTPCHWICFWGTQLLKKHL